MLMCLLIWSKSLCCLFLNSMSWYDVLFIIYLLSKVYFKPWIHRWCRNRTLNFQSLKLAPQTICSRFIPDPATISHVVKIMFQTGKYQPSPTSMVHLSYSSLTSSNPSLSLSSGYCPRLNSLAPTAHLTSPTCSALWTQVSVYGPKQGGVSATPAESRRDQLSLQQMAHPRPESVCLAAAERRVGPGAAPPRQHISSWRAD
jgi:hypothetical protein